MKKMLSIFLVATLVLTSLFALPASAEKNNLSDFTQLVEIAKITFPEHAEKISKNQTTRSINPESNLSEVYAVIQETRPFENNTMVTYTEYNNGVVALGAVRFAKTADLTVEDSETYSNYELFTAKIIASVIEGPTFTATDAQYRIYPSSYDRITSVGNYGIPGYSRDDFTVFLRSIETSTQPARAVYSFVCPVGTTYYDGSVIFDIRNNVPSVTFDIW